MSDFERAVSFLLLLFLHGSLPCVDNFRSIYGGESGSSSLLVWFSFVDGGSSLRFLIIEDKVGLSLLQESPSDILFELTLWGSSAEI